MAGEQGFEKQWQGVYKAGAVFSIIVILATIADIIIGTMSGGSLATLPQTAMDRFAQFQGNVWLGLYNLDFLNFCTAILLVPAYFAICAVYRKENIVLPLLGTLIYIMGTIVMITNNSALAMMELSSKFAAATDPVQKNLLAAAGEAMLAKGAHGSPGAFTGFMLSTIAIIVMSLGMVKGKVFSKATGYVGLSGGILLIVYLSLVTFVPQMKSIAMMIAAPVGLLSLAWMIMFTIKLFKLE